MNKEQRARAGYREIVEEHGDGTETRIIVRVSGQLAELTRGEEHPWDNENGTGNDETWETWPMSLDTLKLLIGQAKIVIQQSEAYEARKNQPVNAWEALRADVERMRLPALQAEVNAILEKKKEN